MPMRAFPGRDAAVEKLGEVRPIQDFDVASTGALTAEGPPETDPVAFDRLTAAQSAQQFPSARLSQPLPAHHCLA